jgi:hypothetical protein
MRQSLNWLLALIAALGLTWCEVAASPPGSPIGPGAGRQRNVIFNNDGDEAWLTDAPATPEGFLAVRMDHIGDCGVDSVFFCDTHGFNLFTHDSEVSEVFTDQTGKFKNNRAAALIEQGTDTLKLAIEACRQRDIEIVWSLRMNDIHDSWTPQYVSKWKKNNPTMLMGKLEDYDRFPLSDTRSLWSFVDFAHQEVRDQTVAIVKDVLARYDVDGIELDFLRTPCYFKETQSHQPVTAEHRAMLTDMVEQIRREVVAAGQQKDKRILLIARVLPTLSLNRRFGFDVERWVSAGSLDLIVVSGGYDPFTISPKQIIELGHRRGIPVYLCLSSSGMIQRGVEGSDLAPDNIQGWRAAAANAWQAGADGIVTFNLYPKLPGTKPTNHARAVWTDISDPQTLASQDKLYCIENLDHSRTHGPMIRSVPWGDRLPAVVERGKTTWRNLPVADNLPHLQDRIKTLRLRVCLDGWQSGDVVTIAANGQPLTTVVEEPGWLAAKLSPSFMKQGANVIAVGYEQGRSKSLTITSVELTVQYHQ